MDCLYHERGDKRMKVNRIVDSFVRAATLALGYLDLVIFMLPCWRQKDQVNRSRICFFLQFKTNTKNDIEVFEGLWIRCCKTYRSENYQCSKNDLPETEKQRFVFFIVILLTFMFNFFNAGSSNNRLPFYFILGGSGKIKVSVLTNVDSFPI